MKNAKYIGSNVKLLRLACKQWAASILSLEEVRQLLALLEKPKESLKATKPNAVTAAKAART